MRKKVGTGVCAAMSSSLEKLEHFMQKLKIFDLEIICFNLFAPVNGVMLLLINYKKLPAFYTMVLLRTLYDLTISHNTSRLTCHNALFF